VLPVPGVVLLVEHREAGVGGGLVDEREGDERAVVEPAVSPVGERLFDLRPAVAGDGRVNVDVNSLTLGPPEARHRGRVLGGALGLGRRLEAAEQQQQETEAEVLREGEFLHHR
jgi:hypothetical protein